MRDHFAIGFAQEFAAVGDQLVAQRLEILDDAVVDQRHRPGDVRMGIVDRRRAMRRPARMGDADIAVQRFRGEHAREIVELALGTAAIELAALNRADAGHVIAAIFEALQTVEQALRHRFATDDPDNSAHVTACPSSPARAAEARRPSRQIPLLAARDRQLVRRDILGHHRACANDRAAPMLTGATSALFEPMKAPAPISVRYLPKPS